MSESSQSTLFFLSRETGKPDNAALRCQNARLGIVAGITIGFVSQIG